MLRKEFWAWWFNTIRKALSSVRRIPSWEIYLVTGMLLSFAGMVLPIMATEYSNWFTLGILPLPIGITLLAYSYWLCIVKGE